MEFNQKLQELRKQKSLTQEELAAALFVSRTAISKWESGRGYPNIDSLKEIANYFEITIDELLSSEELLTVAKEDTKKKEKRFCDLVFGLLDFSAIMLIFLPFFAVRIDGIIKEGSLLSLSEIATYLRISYFIIIVGITVLGVLRLALQNCSFKFWQKYNNLVSMILNALGALVFIISQQPYAAIFLFSFFIIKAIISGKKR